MIFSLSLPDRISAQCFFRAVSVLLIGVAALPALSSSLPLPQPQDRAKIEERPP